MSAPQNNPHTSDNESAERPVREKLRKASIAAPTEATTKSDTTQATAASQPDEKPRGRLQRKRSHGDEDVEEEEPAHKTRHGRKRSRENPPEDEDPKQAKSDARPTIEPEVNHTKTATTKIPAGSAFANTSAASPFASLAASKSPSEQPAASTSAFASSGFGALAASSTSGFGALAQSKPLSSFASPSPTRDSAPTNENSKPETKSAFGANTTGPSPFAAAGASGLGGGSAFGGASGFGNLGNGFGSGSGFGGGFGGLGGSKLTSFASSGTPGVIGSSKTSIKAFGTPADDDEDKSGDEEDGDAGAKSPKPVEEENKDERFFEQDIETGEENETTEYTCRAKLYNFVDKKEWKERGLGVVRLNVMNPKPSEESSVPKARLLMRADGSHRVILNTPIQKGLNFGTVKGERPTGGYIYFMGSIDGQPKLELLQLKVRQQFALELWDHVADLQKQM